MRLSSVETRSAADRLYRTGEEVRDEIQKAMEEAKEELQKMTKTVKEEVSKITDGVRLAVVTMAASMWERYVAATPASYAEALSARLPLVHPNTLAQYWIRERQVLVDRDPGVVATQLEVLNECELVVKANEAIVAITSWASQGMDEARVVGARQLRNGGVLYELNNAKAATWLQNKKVTFIEQYGAMLVMKEKAISVMMEYVPTSHSPDVLAKNRKIECNSGIAAEDLISTRWIKPEQRWAPGQCIVH